MFIFNCQVKTDEQLKYPIEKESKKNSKNKNKKNKKQVEDQANNEEPSYDLYKPVACKYCATEVGVYDEKDEVYHFFNVLASH